MPSFQVVSNTDLMEVDNAVNNVLREIKNRFDFKGSNCNIQRNENEIIINADDNMKMQQLEELLKINFKRRKIDQKALNFQIPEKASGDSLKQTIKVIQGIDKDTLKQISKTIKDTKLKVQASIETETLRVSGKNRDDLQKTIQTIKDMDLNQILNNPEIITSEVINNSNKKFNSYISSIEDLTDDAGNALPYRPIIATDSYIESTKISKYVYENTTLNREADFSQDPNGNRNTTNEDLFNLFQQQFGGASCPERDCQLLSRIQKEDESKTIYSSNIQYPCTETKCNRTVNIVADIQTFRQLLGLDILHDFSGNRNPRLKTT